MKKIADMIVPEETKSNRSTKLKQLRPGVYAGNIDVRTPSGEDYYTTRDRASVMAELVKRKKETG